jgi:peroxiredoxin
MAIRPGERIPDVPVWVMGEDGPMQVFSCEVMGRGRVVLFAVPGAFTPGCSQVHLPGYLQRADDLSQRGVDRIVCLSVNDAWVMDAWGRSQEVGDTIAMVADGEAAFTNAMGMAQQRRTGGLGLRSRRYAAVLHDGIVQRLDVEPSGGVTVSSCAALLQHL